MAKDLPLIFEAVDRATPDQLKKLSHIHQLAFSHIGQDGWSHEALANSCAATGSLLISALRDNQPIGFALFRQVLDEAELITLAVAPDNQGRSVGSKLLQWAEDQLRSKDVCTVFLEVRADNAAAIRLYENLGFKATSVRKAYYKLAGAGRVDAVNYAKALY